MGDNKAGNKSGFLVAKFAVAFDTGLFGSRIPLRVHSIIEIIEIDVCDPCWFCEQVSLLHAILLMLIWLYCYHPT